MVFKGWTWVAQSAPRACYPNDDARSRKGVAVGGSGGEGRIGLAWQSAGAKGAGEAAAEVESLFSFQVRSSRVGLWMCVWEGFAEAI